MVYGGHPYLWQDPAVGDENGGAPGCPRGREDLKSYMSSILRLALLALDIVEATRDGRSDQALTLEQLERPLPANWDGQRKQLL
jgi:hypothetical protein